MPRRPAVKVLLALAIAGGLAATATPAAAQAKQEIPFPLTFNEVPKGEIPVVLANGDVFVLPADLERAGVTGTMWERLVRFARLRDASHITSGGRDFISLRAFAPLLTFVLDEENLTLSITAQPELLTPSTFNVETGPPANMTYSRDTSTFVNYALTTAGRSQTSAFVESGTSIAGNLLYNSVGRDESGKVVRFLTNYTVDDRKRLNRWVFGDSNVISDALGGSPLIGGVTSSRNFNLDPYFVRYPPLNFRGTALTPSRVEIYMNGSLVALQDIPPGPFELRNIPASAGAGTERVVIRDVFGREQVSGAAYYYSTDVLARGVSEYVYSAGMMRERFGRASFDYTDPAVLAYHRIGVTEDFTAGGRIEASKSVFSAGPRATKRTSRGDFGLAAAVSRDRGENGVAAEFAYRYLARRFSFGGSVQVQSYDYANLTQRKEQDRALFNAHTFASYLTRLASLSLIWDRANMRDQIDTDRIMLMTNVPVTRRASVFLSVGGADEGSGRKVEAFAGVSFFVGNTTTASVSVNARGGRTDTAVDIQKSTGIGTGFGYRLHANKATSGTDNGSAAVQYQTGFGRYELSFNPVDLQERPTLTATGGFVYQKGAFVASRAVADSFALVRIPGVSNVRVYSSNMLVGRTDHNGDLLVPNLLSYYGNRLRIEDRDVPLNYEVAATERTVAPPYRGGAFVQFPVRQIRTITGRVVIRNGTEAPPSYGELTVTAGTDTFVSPLGKSGEFYLENTPSGSHSATVDYKDGSCTFQLVIPAGTDSVVKLGTVRCTQGPTP